MNNYTLNSTYYCINNNIVYYSDDEALMGISIGLGCLMMILISNIYIIMFSSIVILEDW